ncbi:MAG: hypothetical protein MZV65_16260 [Chromatiales bacterium]|nr:hypothetical protein [Chromatiales bacterium]
MDGVVRLERQEEFDEVYRSCLGSLHRQKETDGSFTLETARGVLEHLYVQEGNDWTGRGEVQDIQIEASIAAYERFLSDWASEPASRDKESICPSK